MTLTLVLELKDVPILILCCLTYSFTLDACSRFASLGGEPKAVEGRGKPFNRCYAKHSAHCCPSLQLKVCCCHFGFLLVKSRIFNSVSNSGLNGLLLCSMREHCMHEQCMQTMSNG